MSAALPSPFDSVRAPADLYLVRHGESEGNARAVVQGLLDLPLTDAGRSQARACGEWFAPRKPRTVLCSPLARARETAEILADAAGCAPPRAEPALTELDAGAFSGLSLREAAERYPAAYADFQWMSWEAVPGAEREESLRARALGCWGMVLAEEGPVVAVTHGGFIQWLFKATFGPGSWMPLVSTGNCGVFHLALEPSRPGRPPHMQWRLVNHLPEALGPARPSRSSEDATLSRRDR